MEELSNNIVKELTLKVLRERSELIDNYEKGHTKDLKLDPWDDPEIQIYHCIDRYGFISDEKGVNEQKEDSKKARQKALKVKKWLKICEKWAQFEGTDKLRERVYKGVPLQVKGRVWLVLLGVQETMKKNQGVYEKMKDLGKSWGLELRQIDLDVNRTYRNHIMFRSRYDVKQQALFNLLVAYSVYNSEVGYCQGMSQVAALLLMFLNEEEAFWAFASLMTGERHRMHGFFIAKFPKLSRYQEHYNKALKKSMPKLKKHLDKNEMFPNLYTVKWFLQCFLDRLPFTLTLRFWDIYILEGERILIAMAVTIMKMHKNSLLHMDMEGMMEFFTSHISHAQPLSDDKIVSLLKSTFVDLRRWKLSNPACSVEEAVEEGVKKEMASYDKPSMQQLKAVYVDCGGGDGEERVVVGEGGLVDKMGVEIPADGGKEHLPSFTKHRFSQMIDFESESEDADVKDVDFEISRLSSRTSLTNSDLPSPSTSIASPARITFHKHFRNAAVTPNSLDDDNSVFSSSSSLSSQQTNYLRKGKKENSQNPLEMLQALNDMLPSVSSSSNQPSSTQTLSTQTLTTQSSISQASPKPSQLRKIQFPRHSRESFNNYKNNPPTADQTNKSSTTVCSNIPPPIPSTTSTPHQRPNIFSDLIFSPPLKSQLLNQSFTRKKQLRSEGDNTNNHANFHIPIFHIPPSPLQQIETPTFQSDSIRSRLSLHHWPTPLAPKSRPLSTHLTEFNNSCLPSSTENYEQTGDHTKVNNNSGNINSNNNNNHHINNSNNNNNHKNKINFNYNSVPTTPSNSLTPITVLHLKTLSPFHLSTSNNTHDEASSSHITTSSSLVTSSSLNTSSAFIKSSSSSPSHKKLDLSGFSIPENVEATYTNSNHHDKQPPTLLKPLLFTSLKSPSHT